MAKRGFDSVTATMQQHQGQLSWIRRAVDFVIHPKAVDGRVSSRLECAGVHGAGGETTTEQEKAIEAFIVRESASALSDLCKLCFRPDVRGNRALARYRSDFHADAVRQAGTFPCDGDRFVDRGYVEKEVTANCFFGLGEWTVGHDTVFPRHDFSFAFQGISRDRFAFIG